jgi:PAS domain S-box-containing protein
MKEGFNWLKRQAIFHILLPTLATVFMLFLAYLLFLPKLHDQFLESNKQRIKDQVINAHKILESYNSLVQKKQITLEEAQKLAIETLKGIQYENNKENFFWIHNYNSVPILHPQFRVSDSALVQDPLKSPIPRMTRMAIDSGECFFEYNTSWSKGTNQHEEKISYVKCFPAWHWIVGTGIYKQKVQDDLNRYSLSLINFFYPIILTLLLLISLIFILSIRNVKKILTKEAELEQSESRFRNMVQHIDDGLIILEDRNIVFVNNQLLTIFGISEEEKDAVSIATSDTNNNSLSLFSFLPIEERERLISIIKGNIRIDKFDCWIEKRNGERRYLNNRVTYNTLNEKSIAYIVTTDLTEKRKILAELNQLSEAITQSPNSFVITDLEGKIKYVNSRFTKVTGYTAEEAIGQNPRILKSDKMPQSLYIDLWKTISSGKVWKNEMLNRKKNGDLFWESTIIFPMFNESNEIINYAAIKTDITKQRQIENELVEEKEKAYESERLKTAFLNNVSHEVRTPLNAIYGFTGLLRNKIAGDEKLFTYLQTVERNVEILLKLFEDIIDYAALESKSIRLEKEDIKLNELLPKIISKYNTKIISENKRIEIILAEDPNYPTLTIHIDKKWFTQILDKLVSNAFKYTARGYVKIGYTIKPEALEFYVKDTGVGIFESEKTLIFNSFYHGAGHYVSQHKGTGLGLNITKLLVEMMGGKIWFTSREGEGSTFYFSIPSTDVKNYTIGNTEVFEYSGLLNNKTILVAEDNEENFKYLDTLLSDKTTRLLWAKNGNEAIDIYDRHRDSINLILTDLLMPTMDGFSSTKVIRSYGTTIPIIALQNAGVDLSDEEASLFNGIINKPVSRNNLFELLENVLRKKQG